MATFGAWSLSRYPFVPTLTPIQLWLAGSALTDTLIAVAMTFLPDGLMKLLRSRTGDYDQTDNILVRIVRLTVETNTATASIAIAVLVCLLAIPHNPSISMAPAYALGKLYSNTLLAIFNNRIYMSSKGAMPRNRHSDTATTMGLEVNFRQPHSSQTESSRKSMLKVKRESQSEPYQIQVLRQTEVSRDMPLKEFELQNRTPTSSEIIP
ncbi:hypothetical protein H0H93_010865 [Arthromyces matolae]|nr:hypothetical protein H0H93_010865 [Arthromyces matolae]